MIKNILAVIGAVMLVVALGVTVQFGTKVSKLDNGALPAYMTMFDNVLAKGDPARAMMNEYKVAEDVENEDAVDAIKAITEELNMRVTGDIKMYTKEDAAANEVKHARIISVCSLEIAKVFLNYSRYYGGFMPCRIMLVEYGNGDRFLVTMDLNLAIHGGHDLPADMLEKALFVQKAMKDIPSRAAKGEF
ncbi:DUF302 domain-containing protein [Sulfurimonas lithotrophica]|uniref:DUF302 domain-containing protein n=1 Tax=Sulfurimonas lithotrophica TaxID=2590022 RepID=A0A5P8NXU3_9BACT|nr:DUF302 domain-containing protein [Sulfurimonas lithotrophica]QFR48229.1 DUF302 domain-containing protein [Sulfurimonas lithotrophica]